MNEGKIVQVGTPEAVYRRPANVFIAGFLGKPPMNLFPGKVVGDSHGAAIVVLDGLSEDSQKAAIQIKQTMKIGRVLVVGFRPDHVNVSKEENRNVSSQAWSLSGQVTHIEGMDPEYIVHCETDLGSILVRTRSKPVGDAIWLTLPPSKAHCFDGETGKRID